MTSPTSSNTNNCNSTNNPPPRNESPVGQFLNILSNIFGNAPSRTPATPIAIQAFTQLQTTEEDDSFFEDCAQQAESEVEKWHKDRQLRLKVDLGAQRQRHLAAMRDMRRMPCMLTQEQELNLQIYSSFAKCLITEPPTIPNIETKTPRQEELGKELIERISGEKKEELPGNGSLVFSQIIEPPALLPVTPNSPDQNKTTASTEQKDLTG